MNITRDKTYYCYWTQFSSDIWIALPASVCISDIFTTSANNTNCDSATRSTNVKIPRSVKVKVVCNDMLVDIM